MSHHWTDKETGAHPAFSPRGLVVALVLVVALWVVGWIVVDRLGLVHSIIALASMTGVLLLTPLYRIHF